MENFNKKQIILNNINSYLNSAEKNHGTGFYILDDILKKYSVDDLSCLSIEELESILVSLKEYYTER